MTNTLHHQLLITIITIYMRYSSDPQAMIPTHKFHSFSHVCNNTMQTIYWLSLLILAKLIEYHCTQQLS